MLSVSNDYKDKIDSTVQEWSSRVIIDYTDYNLDNSITSIVNDSDRLSDDAQLADGIETPTHKWWSWNNFEWGQHMRSESPTFNEKGALSNRLSFADSTFSQAYAVGFNAINGFGSSGFVQQLDYPSFSLQFSPRTINALKVVFDSKLEEWGVDFDVNVYVGSTIDTTEVITGNTSVQWEKNILSSILLATQVEVVVKKWSHAASKAKVMETFTSIQIIYEQDEIISIDVNEEADPKKATTPIGNVTANQCVFSLVNINNEFDNDNEASILAGNVIKNRRVRPFLLHKLSGEELPLGTFYTKNWKIQNNKLLAEGSCQDIIALMAEQRYTKSQWIQPGSDQLFLYNTTADFDTFTLSSVTSAFDELFLNDNAPLCGTLDSSFGFGVGGFGAVGFNGAGVCGIAKKQITYNYTPGTTVKVIPFYSPYSFPMGTGVRVYINGVEVGNAKEYRFVPDDVDLTTQQLDLEVVLYSESATDYDIAIDIVGVVLKEAVTLYSLARAIIDDFDDNTGLIGGNYSIDQQYGEYEIPSAYLKPQTHKAAIKLVAEAAAGRVYSSRLGIFEVKSIESLSGSAAAYNNSNVFDSYNPVNDQNLYNRVTVQINPLTQNATPERVATATIDILDTETKTYTLSFTKQPVDSITASFNPSLPAGVSFDGTEIFTWGAAFTFTNTSGSNQSFSIEVNGKVYEVLSVRTVQLDDTDSIRKNGIIEYVVDNPLIQTEEQALQVAQLLIDSFGQARREIEIDCLANPAIEVGDTFEYNNNAFIVNGQEFKISAGRLDHNIRGKR